MRIKLLITILLLSAVAGTAQRRITPVDSQAKPVIITNAERAKARKDSIAAARDSIRAVRATLPKVPTFPDITVGVNLWDPAMRVLGQDYGIADASVELNILNRFFPVLEAGVGMADHYGDDKAYHYKSPVAPFFKLGMNYNFMFSRSPDYKLCVGFRYGFTPFKFEVTDIRERSTYWGEEPNFAIPSQSVTAGYLELLLSMRIRLVGNFSMGWSFRYHNLLHGGKTDLGKASYIPGYGSINGSVTGSFSVYYTLPLHKKPKAAQSKPDVPELTDDEILTN